MTADELKQAGRALFGYGWQTRLADVLGVDGSTVRRWVSSGLPVAGSAAALLDALSERQGLRGELHFERRRDDDPATPTGTRMGPPTILRDVKDGTEFRMPRADLDAIAQGRDVVMTRHPDRWHLDGYLRAIRLGDPEIVPFVREDGDRMISVLERRSGPPGPSVLYQDVRRDGVILEAVTPIVLEEGKR